MRVALLADIHGNLPALQAVLADLQGFHPDHLVIAGDLVGGPFSNEVIQLLSELGAVMIAGNSDLTLIRYLHHQGPPEWNTRKQFALLRWHAQNLRKDNFQLLSGLPEQRVITLPGTHAIHLVHGTPRDPYESIYPTKDISVLDLALSMIAEPVLACGHTHEAWCLQRHGKMAVNPGSVAGPLNSETGAQYACLEWQGEHWQVTLKRVTYDFALIKKAFIESGMLAAGGPIARGFLLSIESGKDVTLAFLTFAYKKAELAGLEHCQFLPDDIYDLAEAGFAWERWSPVE